jgi:hypothetical protein
MGNLRKTNESNKYNILSENIEQESFRKAIRIEEAKQRESERDMILDTRTRDMRLFHKLVRNNRKKGHNLIDDLYVNEADLSVGFLVLFSCDIHSHCFWLFVASCRKCSVNPCSTFSFPEYVSPFT